MHTIDRTVYDGVMFDVRLPVTCEKLLPRVAPAMGAGGERRLSISTQSRYNLGRWRTSLVNLDTISAQSRQVEDVVGPAETLVPAFAAAFAACKEAGLRVTLTTSL